jgi:membrane associated rhomboid family serine protease
MSLFVSLPSRQKAPRRWAVPVLFVLLWACFLAFTVLPDPQQQRLMLDWGALSGGMAAPSEWMASLRDGRILRLFTALFLHADWAHLLGQPGVPADLRAVGERAMGPWRLLALFLFGGAVANLAAVVAIGTPDRLIIGASGAVSALIGAYLPCSPAPSWEWWCRWDCSCSS